MRRFPLIAAAAAVCSASVMFAACGERPAPVSGGVSGEVGDEAGNGTSVTAPLALRSLGKAELMLFMPRSVALARSPTPGATRVPEADGGVLRYGVFNVAARGEIPKGRIHFALLIPEASEDAADPGLWRLFVDRDLDGDLAEERPVEARPRALEIDVRGRKISAQGALFPAVKTVLPGGGRHAYVVTAYRLAGKFMVDVRSAVALSGQVNIFGAERAVVVYDSNANARFGDIYRGPLVRTDDIGIDLDGDGKIGRDEIRPLARRMYHDGLSATVSVAGDARSITIEQLAVKTGALSRAGDEAEEDILVQLSSPEYGTLWSLRPDRLPAGRHLLAAYVITREDQDADAKGKWVLSGKWLTRPAPVVGIPPGGTAEVRFGPPLTARAAVAFLEDARLAIVQVSLSGPGREDATVVAGDLKPRLGTWRVVDSNGAEHGSGKLFPGLLPGLWRAQWKTPDGLEKGRRLVFEVVPDLGPFAEGFDGRTPFEYGVSTRVTLIVIGIEKGSQAEDVGVERGDVIVSYDGREIRNEIDMSIAVRDAMKKTGTVELVVRRKGETKRFDVKPGPLGVNVRVAAPTE